MSRYRSWRLVGESEHMYIMPEPSDKKFFAGAAAVIWNPHQHLLKVNGPLQTLTAIILMATLEKYSKKQIH
jgi:hypothetical protein